MGLAPYSHGNTPLQLDPGRFFIQRYFKRTCRIQVVVSIDLHRADNYLPFRDTSPILENLLSTEFSSSPSLPRVFSRNLSLSPFTFRIPERIIESFSLLYQPWYFPLIFPFVVNFFTQGKNVSLSSRSQFYSRFSFLKNIPRPRESELLNILIFIIGRLIVSRFMGIGGR